MARPNSGGTFGERAGIGAKGNFVSVLFNMGWVEGFEPSATGTTIHIGQYPPAAPSFIAPHFQTLNGRRDHPESPGDGHTFGHTGTLPGALTDSEKGRSRRVGLEVGSGGQP